MTITDDMVERAAQALINLQWHPPIPLASMSHFDQFEYSNTARAALTAALQGQVVVPAEEIEYLKALASESVVQSLMLTLFGTSVPRQDSTTGDQQS